MSALAAYSGLFITAFIAATLLPAQSEAALAALLLKGSYSTTTLIAVATTGNVLGSVFNWYLGLGIERFRHRRWFPLNEAALDRTQRWYRRWGKWSLLLSWAPFVGDALTLIAGVLREPLLPFLGLVTAAKLGRYLVIAAVILYWPY
ncbi:MAG: YqaA family protein [Steroidobacteraceae bacterium]